MDDNYKPYMEFIEYLKSNNFLSINGTKIKPKIELGQKIHLALNNTIEELTHFLPGEISNRKRLHCILYNVNPNNFQCPVCDEPRCIDKCTTTYRIPYLCSTEDKEHHTYRQRVKLKKVQVTNLKRYGVSWTLSLESVKNKARLTCLTKYGTPYASQNQVVKNKTKETCIVRFGCENPLGNIDVRNKVSVTNLKKYGVKNPGGLKITLQKVTITNLKKYGAYHKNQEHFFMDHYNLLDTEFLQCNFVDKDGFLLLENLAFFINCSLVRARRIFKEFDVKFNQVFGFDITKPGVLYYLLDTTTGMYKSGITNKTVTQRFQKIFNDTPNRILILSETHFDLGLDAFKREQYILKTYKEFRVDNLDWPKDAGGYTEFFNCDIFKEKDEDQQ